MQDSTGRPRRGRPILVALVAAAAAALGWAGRGLVRSPDREVIQEAVIHHFERSSWFATNAPEYEAFRPDLGPAFRERAAWHARCRS